MSQSDLQGIRRNVLGVLVTAIDPGRAVAEVIDAAHMRRPFTVTATAVHGLMVGVEDPRHRYRLNSFDMVLPDGQPVRWALNLLHGCRLQERVAGPDFMWHVCDAAARRHLPVYFFGSTAGTLRALSERLQQQMPALRIAGCSPSAFRVVSRTEMEATAQTIRASGAAVVFVGLGCPRQEVWAWENRALLNMPLLAVGAAFDIHAGLVPRAPAVLGRLGLEWVFRLTLEPRRLWRRYLRRNPRFLALLALQATGMRRFDPLSATPHTDEVRFG